MNWQLLLPLLITSIVTMLGWVAVHNFARKRDFENKKKELRINYLIEVWRKLINVSNRGKVNQEKERKELSISFEQIVADIQLFGTPKQIELIKMILVGLKENHTVKLDNLLDDLRNSLRKEIGVEAIEGAVHLVRFND